MKNKKKKPVLSEKILRSLSKGGTYRFDVSVALELEVYGTVKTHGSKANIIQEALTEWYKKNPLNPKVRDAALLIMEQEEKR